MKREEDESDEMHKNVNIRELVRECAWLNAKVSKLQIKNKHSEQKLSIARTLQDIARNSKFEVDRLDQIRQDNIREVVGECGQLKEHNKMLKGELLIARIKQIKQDPGNGLNSPNQLEIIIRNEETEIFNEKDKDFGENLYEEIKDSSSEIENTCEQEKLPHQSSQSIWRIKLSKIKRKKEKCINNKTRGNDSAVQVNEIFYISGVSKVVQQNQVSATSTSQH